ncbi:MAG: hypothetical protein Q8P20_10825 [bacterium]|nr:hypothetical protein [bacterium]
MSISLKNVIKLLNIALIGGLCSFAFGFLISPLLPYSIVTSVAAGLAPGLVAFFGSIIAIIFLKKPKKIPVFIFCWGFILVNKFFEGVFVTIDRLI